MRVRFCNKQEVPAESDDVLTQEFSRVQVVTEVNRSQVLIAHVVLVQPLFSGIGFTVLFTDAILRENEFGSKRSDAVMLGRHDGGAQYFVMIGGDAVAGSSAALLAANVLGLMELQGIKGNQDALIETLERRKTLILCQLFNCLLKCWVKRLAGDAIELFTDVVIGGDALHAK